MMTPSSWTRRGEYKCEKASGDKILRRREERPAISGIALATGGLPDILHARFHIRRRLLELLQVDHIAFRDSLGYALHIAIAKVARQHYDIAVAIVFVVDLIHADATNFAAKKSAFEIGKHRRANVLDAEDLWPGICGIPQIKSAVNDHARPDQETEYGTHQKITNQKKF
jgi:hypothetical protein